MNSDQFAAFEFMCRERAAIAKREMEYWLAEAEEWRQFQESRGRFVDDGTLPASSGFTESSYQKFESRVDASRRGQSVFPTLPVITTAAGP